jgi:hypothetical protein
VAGVHPLGAAGGRLGPSMRNHIILHVLNHIARRRCARWPEAPGPRWFGKEGCEAAFLLLYAGFSSAGGVVPVPRSDAGHVCLPLKLRWRPDAGTKTKGKQRNGAQSTSRLYGAAVGTGLQSLPGAVRCVV